MQTQLDRHTVGLLLAGAGADAWGIAENDPPLPLAPSLPIAISVAMRLSHEVVRQIADGPTAEYLAEFRRLNRALDEATAALAQTIREAGYRSECVPATSAERPGLHAFPHKTAATRAGLGWIGKTALFVSREFGPAVRLATVFTDLPLPAGSPVDAGRCGDCIACVRACPVDAGRDVTWRAGMARAELYDADACRRHMENTPAPGTENTQAPGDLLCGICIGACPLARGRPSVVKPPGG